MKYTAILWHRKKTCENLKIQENTFASIPKSISMFKEAPMVDTVNHLQDFLNWNNRILIL